MITASRERLADAVFLLAALVMILVRFRILREGGAPPTIDAGDWLAHGDAIFGSRIRSSVIVYPPLVPILTKASVAAFGLTGGVSLLGAIAATAPAAGLYLALRMIGAGFVAIGPALLLLGAGSIGEATAWGGYPQLIGLGLAPLVLILVDRVLSTWESRDALAAGFTLAALMATSHFITSAVGLGVIALVILRLPELNRPSASRMLRCIVLVLLPTLWLVPLYLVLISAFAGVSREFSFFNELTWSGLWDQIEFLYRDLAWLWRVLVASAVVAPIFFLRHRATPLWRLTTSMLLAIVGILALTREGRFVYLLTPYTALGVSLWVAHGPARVARMVRGWTQRGVTAAALSALLIAALIQIDTGKDFFRNQRSYYGVLTPDLVAGIEYVKDTTSPDTVLAVTSLNDAPLGRWVEAIADRETYYGAPLQWLLFEVDLERSALANELFIPPFPDETRIRAAAEQGIDLILVPTGWVFYDEDGIDEFATSNPDAVEYVTPELVVIDPTKLP
ncbi:MAG: hypothetical protein IH941_01200 [Acidobacteria bacterium]|nr:hypothetical protein [Acidobacteriota bacterium]